MPPIALRPRSIGEILDAGFQVYRRGWMQMAIVTAVLISPLLVLQVVVSLEALVWLQIGIGLFYTAASAAVILIAAEAYLGRTLSVEGAIRTTFRRFLSVWGAAIIQGILIMIGTLLFIIPGILMFAWTFAMQQAVMVEGRRAGEAFDRSRTLTRGHVWHVLGVSIVAFLITYLANSGLSLLLGPRVLGLGIRENVLALNAFLIFLNPLAYCISTALYFDLRVRKEAFDVQVLADQLGGEVEPSPA